MNRYSRTLRNYPFRQGIGGFLIALICVAALFGCGGGDDTINNISQAGTALNIQVNPASTTVVVTGPDSYSQTFTGNQILTDLTPGDYAANATAPGFVASDAGINVVEGHTSNLAFVLEATPIISEAPHAVYRNGQGNLIPLDNTSLQSGEFVFYAWLQDEAFGILPENVSANPVTDPLKPLVAEQTETAPSLTQNLAGAWVGFRDSTGVIRPVIGADVRWEIDQQYASRVGSMQFGTSDDNRIASGYGVFDDQADTRTNNAHLAAERFPLVATEYPLFNQSGIGSPFADGFTWVTLFSPDATASARIVAVASFNGEEIGKQILYKNFAPSPELSITKTVDNDIVDVSGGPVTVTWTVTASNTGLGDATNVDLSDTLASGVAANYTLTAPGGTTPVGDGFTTTIATLPAPGTPAPPQVPQLLGDAKTYAVLAYAAVTNTGSSVVTGNVGVSAGSAVTGFPPGIVQSGIIHNNDASAAAAQLAVTAAYTSLNDTSTLPCTGAVDQALTGVFTPGVYCYTTSVTTGTALTLDAGGDPEAKFVFRTGTTLDTPAGLTVSLINGADPCNIYWRVGSSATLGNANFFVGNILADQSITVGTGSSVSGRLLARNGAVSMSGDDVTAPLSCGVTVPPSSTQTYTFTADVTAAGTYCNAVAIPQYDTPTDTINPTELDAQACVTAIATNLSIVKDFVAADNTTSLGHSVTVAANEHAKLRVRVLNSGTATATATLVNVIDAFDAAAPTNTGLIADYELLNVSSGTMSDSDANSVNDGFDTGTTIADLAPGESATLLFTVTSAVDGVYCDTATLSDSVGLQGSDTACLTVSTPNLTITKVDTPATNVLPGETYTSTIVVNNIGTATAKNVVISDLLGVNTAVNIQAVYVSSSLNGAGGTLVNNVVTANSVTIPAAGSVTFTVVSRIPLGALSGSYCDTATVTSSNATTKEASDCVDVPSFSALQTQLIDAGDPLIVGNNLTYFTVLFVEPRSNEGVHSNVVSYSLGLDNPLNIGDPGSFVAVSTKVYLDSNPVTDPVTGVVVSDTASPTAVLKTAGTDYTVDNSVAGYQVITMAPAVVLQPNTALYVVHVVSAPTGIATNQLYTTSYVWDSVGYVNPLNTYSTSSSEATTVIP
jgi:uncharacterized repeat protein (TIGR01451 family)